MSKKAPRMTGIEKINFYQEYVDNDFSFMFKKYGYLFNNWKHLNYFLSKRCYNYWMFNRDKSFKVTSIDKIMEEMDNRTRLGNKKESYWQTENDLIYTPPKPEELTGVEKQMYYK